MLEPPALVQKHPTPLWDGVVRVGSLCLNHPEGVLARGGSSTANLFEPHETHQHRASKVCRVLKHSFRVVQAQRTYTNHTLTVLKVCRALVCRVLLH